MIDLVAEARALAEAARADTSDGLEARERLIPVALELVAALEAADSETATEYVAFAVRATVTRFGGEREVYHHYDDLEDAREKVRWWGPTAVVVSRWVKNGRWVPVPVDAESADA